MVGACRLESAERMGIVLEASQLMEVLQTFLRNRTPSRISHAQVSTKAVTGSRRVVLYHARLDMQ
jgi:catalase